MTTSTGVNIVYLNVGGHHFATTLETLSIEKDSRLGQWFSVQPTDLPIDKNECIFIDRDGRIFGFILNYLRLKTANQQWAACLPSRVDHLAQLAQEADYYGLSELKHKSSQLLTSLTDSRDVQYFNGLLGDNISCRVPSLTRCAYSKEAIYLPGDEANQ